MHFSLTVSPSFFFFFFCLSLNTRQVTVISTLLDAIVNLCFARSPRAKGSNFRTCAIAACPGFRDSPLMRMSMNRTLPDLPFACPGRSGYEIRCSCVQFWRENLTYFPGDQPLTKSRRNSELEIAPARRRHSFTSFCFEKCSNDGFFAYSPWKE